MGTVVSSVLRFVLFTVWSWDIFSFSILHAATIDLTGPVELHVTSFARSFNVQLSSTNDVYLDIEPFLRNGFGSQNRGILSCRVEAVRISLHEKSECPIKFAPII